MRYAASQQLRWEIPLAFPAYLDGGLSGDMRDQEVHGNILAVDVIVHHVTDGLRHHVGIQVGVVLQREDGRWVTGKPTPCKNASEATGKSPLTRRNDAYRQRAPLPQPKPLHATSPGVQIQSGS